MANSLNRDIKAGEVVVVKSGAYPGPLRQRLFMADGQGFGCYDSLAGRAIYGVFVSSGEGSRINGGDIDPEETAAYQKEKAGKENGCK